MVPAALLALYVVALVGLCLRSSLRGLRLHVVALLGVLWIVQLEVRILALAPGRPLEHLPTMHWILVGLLVLSSSAAVGRRRAERSRPSIKPRFDLANGLLLTALAMISLAVLVWGQITTTTSVDEFNYHTVQAGLIYQQADLPIAETWIPWTYAYPMGAAMQWAWCLAMGGAENTFRLIQFVYFLLLVLGCLQIYRRGGMSWRAALSFALPVAASPIVFRMGTLSTADIGMVAGAVAAAAFIVPDRRATVPSDLSDMALALVAISLAASVKAPVLPAFVLVVPLAMRAWAARDAVRASVRGRSPSFAIASLGVLALLGIASSSYVDNIIDHGNPLWPIANERFIELEGPHEPIDDDLVNAHTTWSIDGYGDRWLASFLDIRQSLNEDSLGGYGIGLFVLSFAGFAATLVRVRASKPVPAALGAMSGAGLLLLPVTYIPRYGIAALVILAAVLATIGVPGLPRRIQSTLVVGVAVASVVGTLPAVRLVASTQDWYEANSPEQAWWKDRGRSVAETHELNAPPIAPPPDVVTFVRDHVGAHEVVAYTTSFYSSLLWNEDFSNRIEWVDAGGAFEWPRGPHELTPLSSREIERWRAEIIELKPEYVVVYADSDLQEQVPSIGSYELAMTAGEELSVAIWALEDSVDD